MAKTKFAWSLKHCTVTIVNTTTQETWVFSGFTEEAVQFEWMSAKYEDMEMSADGEHFEVYATNDSRLKATFSLFGGTETAVIMDKIRFEDTAEDEYNIMVLNKKVGREAKVEYSRCHNAGPAIWGKKFGNRNYEWQGADGYFNRKVA